MTRQRGVGLLAAAALILVWAVPSDGAVPTFATTKHFRTAAEPGDVVLVDLDGDGRLDAATVGFTPGSVSVLLGDGAGRFRAARVFQTAVRKGDGLAAGDVNGDGKVDLVAGNQSADVVSVLLGNGDGTFRKALYRTAAPSPNAVVVGDVNGDGKADVVTANADPRHVSVLLGVGDGTFRAPTSYAGPQASSLALADLNRDGKPDVAVTNYSLNRPSTVSVLLGRGDGSFVPSGGYRTGADPIAVAAVDVDGDGNLDLVTANFDSADASVLLGNGDGTFRGGRSYAVGREPGDLAAADVDGDGRLDLVFTYDAGATVLPGQSGGRFGPRVRYPTGFLADSLAVGSLNSDARADLAVTDFGDDDIAVLLNATGPLPPCVVPRLTGKTLPSARRALSRAHCRVGRVRSARSRSARRGRVISQSPPPETGLPSGGRVQLVLGKGR